MKESGNGVRRRCASWVLVWMVRLLLALAPASVALTASAAAYVDDATPDVKPADKAVVAAPQPVQLLFQFETKGAPNARATKYLKQQVIDTVKASGLFSTVGEDPTPNGAVLSVVIDNVVEPGEMAKAEGSGAVTGATFFVVGTNATDHYQCHVDYVPSATAAKISRSAVHAVTIQMGLINSPPPHSVKIGAMKDAYFTMVRQIVSNPLNEIAKDPGFLGGGPTATQATASTTPSQSAQGAPTAPDTTAASPPPPSIEPSPAPSTEPASNATAPAAP